MVLKKDIRSWIVRLGEQKFLIGSFALFLAWAGIFEFTNTFFQGYDYRINSVFSSLTTAISAMLVVLLLYAIKKSAAVFPERLLLPIGVLLLTLITLSLFLPYPNQTDYMFFGVQGVIVGTGFAFFLAGLSSQLLKARQASFEVVGFAFILALLLIIVCSSFSQQTLPFFLLTLLFLALLFSSRHRTRRLTTPPLLQKPDTTHIERPALLFAALFSSGFLIQYMVAFHPQSARGVDTFDFVASALGGLSFSSLLSLLVSCILLILIMAFIRQKSQTSFLYVFIITLFAVSFSAFPFMQTSPIPYILVTPCALSALLLALFLLVSAQNFAVDREAEKKYFQAGFSIVMGACCAALTSVILFVFVWNTPFQRQYIIIPIASVTLLIVALLIFSLRTSISDAFFEDRRNFEKQPFATTHLTNTCSLIGKKYNLTTREFEVLLLVAEGRNTPYIEKKLIISRSTVKTHLYNIYRKTRVNSRQELIDLLHTEPSIQNS